MNRNLSIVSFLGMLTIVLGAFGAHALKEKLSITAFQSFETAVRYQMYHVLVLLFVNIFSGFTTKFKNSVTLVFLIGVLFFSGSIYAMTLAGVAAKSIWFITPLGGLLLIVGWGMLLYYFLTNKEKTN